MNTTENNSPTLPVTIEGFVELAHTLTVDNNRLKEQVANLTKSNNSHEYNQTELKNYLNENRDELGDCATDIAEIFGIALTRTYNVEVTYVLKATITSEDELDEGAFEYEQTAEASINWNGVDVESEEINVTNVSLTEENR